MDLTNKVLSLITENDVVSLVKDLIRIPSHQDQPAGEKEAAEFIAGWLKNKGFQVDLRKVVGERPNVIGVRPGSGQGQSLMFCGHLDTVLPGKMTVPPFEGVIKDGKLYGRGSSDMKGGIGAWLIAMRALSLAGAQLKGDVIFAGVMGEESPSNSEGAKNLVAKGPLADMAVVGEATGLDIAAAHKGMQWMRIKVQGKSAHGSVPEQGVNAISRAARLITAIEQELIPGLSKKVHPLVGSPTLNIGRIQGGIQNNIVPDYCWFSLDRRWIPGETLEGLVEEIKQIIDKLKLQDQELIAEIMLEPETIGRDPMEIDPRHPLVETLKQTAYQVRSVKPEVKGVVYWTDGAHLNNAGIPTVIFGPGNIAQAHAAGEYVEIKQLVQAAKIYALLALEICK